MLGPFHGHLPPDEPQPQEAQIAVVTAAQRVLDDAGITIDYLEVRGNDCESLTSPGAARLFVACLVGTTRLIDNCAVELGSV